LIRRLAEYSFELSNQVKRRDLNFASQIADRERRVARFEQQIAGAAQSPESIVSEEHSP
jgi:hypothetical protein